MYILTDVDDVLLDYAGGFTKHYSLTNAKKNVNTFEEAFGFSHDVVADMIQRYNASEHFKNLTSVGGALDAIKKLAGDFEIIAITACGTDPSIRASRAKNLEAIFGEYISDIHYVDLFQSKSDKLKLFKDSGAYWIEDNIKNYYTGLDNGLQSLLLKTEFNAPSNEKTFYNWDDICSHILKSGY